MRTGTGAHVAVGRGWHWGRPGLRLRVVDSAPSLGGPAAARKVATALSCDVAGSTALGELLDAEVLQSVPRGGTPSMRIAQAATTVSVRGVFRIGRGSLLGVAALASLCLSALGSAASGVNGLTINVMYTTSSLQAKLSNGTVLASGTVVPPGPYSVVVYDSSDDSNPLFTMTGPGVSVSSDLNPTGMGIEVPMTFGPFLLEASSSYSIF